MTNLPNDLSSHIEHLYSLEYPSLVTSGTSDYFNSSTLSLMLIYVSMNVDMVTNNRFLIILAKLLSSNMSPFERETFITQANISASTVEQLNTWVNSDWPLPIEPAPLQFDEAQLSLLRARLEAEVHYQAGRICSKVITVRPGKEMEYIGTWVEARDILTVQDPQPQDFPLLALELGELDHNGQLITTLQQAGAFIMATYLHWKYLAVVIKGAVKQAVKVIRDPEVVDPNTLITASQIDWPTLLPMLFPAPDPEPEPEPEP